MPTVKSNSQATKKAASRQAGSQATIGGQLVYHTLRRWWKLVIPVGLLLTAGGIALALAFFQLQYEGVAWLKIDERPVRLVETGYEERSLGVINTQVELLRSPLVMGPALHDPAVANIPQAHAPDAEDWLGKKLVVKPMGQSELYRVSLTTTKPEDAMALVNATVDSYFKLRNQDQTERSTRQIQLLEEERDRMSRELAGLREELQKVAKTTSGQGATDVLAPGADLAEKQLLADAQGRLTAAEIDRQSVQARLQAAEKLVAAPQIAVPESELDRTVDRNPEVAKLEKALTEKRAKMREIALRSAQGEQEPSYQALAAEARFEEQQLAQLAKESRGNARSEAEAKARKKAADDVAMLRGELDSKKIAEQLLRERYDTVVQQLKQPTLDRLQLAAKRSELERVEKLYAQVCDRLTRLRAEQHSPGQVSLLRRADLPLMPVETLPLKHIALAIVLGMGIPFALAMAWESMLGRVTDPDALTDQLDMPLLGEVPRLPRGGLVPGRTLTRLAMQQQRRFEEAVESLRTALMMTAGLRDKRIVVVTSAVSGEGKTSISSQLAVSIARATDEPTLLIDGDMRSPSIHDLFELSVTPGLAEVLSDTARLDHAIVRDAHPHVDLLPAGILRASPHNLLGNGKLDALLAKLTAQYPHIVIDTPPVLPAGEAMVLAAAGEMCILCAMHDRSRMAQVGRVGRQLQSLGVNVAGVVLNGVSARQYNYRYGNYAYAPD